MKRLLLASFLFAEIVLYCSHKDKNNEQAERSEIVQASVNDDRTLKFCLIDHPELAVDFPYSFFDYNFGRYGAHDDRAQLQLGEAYVYYNRHNGHTIISYVYAGFLHVGFIDKDDILQRVYLDGQEHDFVEKGPRYFKHIKENIDTFRPEKTKEQIIWRDFLHDEA